MLRKNNIEQSSKKRNFIMETTPGAVAKDYMRNYRRDAMSTVHAVNSISIQMWSYAAQRSKSVCTIMSQVRMQTNTAADSIYIYPNKDINDARLSAPRCGGLCPTCRQTADLCVGHFGFMPFSLPVFHYEVMHTVMNLLSLICIGCRRLLILEPNKTEPTNVRLMNLKGFLVSQSKFKEYYSELVKTVICPHCNKQIPSKMPYTIKDMTMRRKIKTADNKDADITVYAPEVFGIFENLRLTEIKALGYPVSSALINHTIYMMVNRTALAELLSKPNASGRKLRSYLHDQARAEDVLSAFTGNDEIVPDSVQLHLIEAVLADMRYRVDPKTQRPSDLLIRGLVVSSFRVRQNIPTSDGSTETTNPISHKYMVVLDKVATLDFLMFPKYRDFASFDVTSYTPEALSVLLSDEAVVGALAGLQTDVNQFFHEVDTSHKPSTLKDQLGGKEGLPRKDLGKSSEMSGRSVVAPDANRSGFDTIGVPRAWDRYISKRVVVTPQNRLSLQAQLLAGKVINVEPINCQGIIQVRQEHLDDLRKTDKPIARLHLLLVVGDIVHRRIRDGDWATLNRQPSLHKGSLHGTKIYLDDGSAVKAGLPLMPPMHGDFDGDEMGVQFQQRPEAEAEARLLLTPNFNNMMNDQNGSPMIAPHFSGPLGVASMTENISGFSFGTILPMEAFYDIITGFMEWKKDRQVWDDLQRRAIRQGLGAKLYTGRMLFSLALPTGFSPEILKSDMSYREANEVEIRDGVLIRGQVTGDILKTITAMLAREGVRTRFDEVSRGADFVNAVQWLASEWITYVGHTFSVEDMRLSEQAGLTKIKREHFEEHERRNWENIVFYPRRDPTAKAQTEKVLLGEAERLSGGLQDKVKSLFEDNEIGEDGVTRKVKGGGSFVRQAHRSDVMKSEAMFNMVMSKGQVRTGGGRIPATMTGGRRTFFSQTVGFRGLAEGGLIDSAYATAFTATQTFQHAMATREQMTNMAKNTQETGDIQNNKLTVGFEGNVVRQNGSVVNTSTHRIMSTLFGGDGWSVPALTRVKTSATSSSTKNHVGKTDSFIDFVALAQKITLQTRRDNVATTADLPVLTPFLYNRQLKTLTAITNRDDAYASLDVNTNRPELDFQAFQATSLETVGAFPFKVRSEKPPAPWDTIYQQTTDAVATVTTKLTAGKMDLATAVGYLREWHYLTHKAILLTTSALPAFDAVHQKTPFEFAQRSIDQAARMLVDAHATYIQKAMQSSLNPDAETFMLWARDFVICDDKVRSQLLRLEQFAIESTPREEYNQAVVALNEECLAEMEEISKEFNIRSTGFRIGKEQTDDYKAGKLSELRQKFGIADAERRELENATLQFRVAAIQLSRDPQNKELQDQYTRTQQAMTFAREAAKTMAPLLSGTLRVTLPQEMQEKVTAFYQNTIENAQDATPDINGNGQLVKARQVTITRLETALEMGYAVTDNQTQWRTRSRLTNYEHTKLVATRAADLENPKIYNPPRVPIPPGMRAEISPVQIAIQELRANLLRDYVIVRKNPDDEVIALYTEDGYVTISIRDKEAKRLLIPVANQVRVRNPTTIKPFNSDLETARAKVAAELADSQAQPTVEHAVLKRRSPEEPEEAPPMKKVTKTPLPNTTRQPIPVKVSPKRKSPPAESAPPPTRVAMPPPKKRKV